VSAYRDTRPADVTRPQERRKRFTPSVQAGGQKGMVGASVNRRRHERVRRTCPFRDTLIQEPHGLGRHAGKSQWTRNR
jgi:hypothetical protein